MTRKNSFPLTKNTSVLFVSFSKWIDNKRLPTNGSIEPLRDFLLPKVKKLVIIDQQHPGSEDVMPKIELYSNHKINFKSHKSSWLVYLLEPILRRSKSEETQIIFKIRDFLSVLDWSVRDKTSFDYAICLESVNTIAAILMRKAGKVRKVVYYVSDYSPRRYKSKWFNWIYLSLDRFCATNADYIWDVSPAMQKARIEEAGLNPEKSAPAIHVPNGLYPSQIKANPSSKVNKHALVYMGTVGSDNGPDIAIQSLTIVRKKYKDAVLHLIGGSDKDLVWLKKLAKKLKVEESVFFHGFVESGLDMSEIIRSCAIGLAPYRYIPGSIRLYADAGKIRNYCACGVPVVSSFVPPLGHAARDKGAAVLVKDNPKEFGKAIVNIFSDKTLYNRLRANAIEFSKYNTWDNTFKNALSQMQAK